MTVDPTNRLAARGLSLPEPPKPGGAYASVRAIGGIAYVSVQFPFSGSELAFRGRLGRKLTTEDGYRAAELCALNVLAQISHYIGFERILGLNRIEAHMLTVEGWDDFPEVLDGASNLFLDILGIEAGRYARALFEVERLPMDTPIALTASFTLRP